jgi:hypothetical protein
MQHGGISLPLVGVAQDLNISYFIPTRLAYRTGNRISYRNLQHILAFPLKVLYIYEYAEVCCKLVTSILLYLMVSMVFG